MKYFVWAALVVALFMAAWRIIEPEVTNLVFRDEVRDTAAQLGWRTGYTGPRSEGELRDLVIAKAARHDIALLPQQVTVRREGTQEAPSWYIAVDYVVKIDLLVFSYAKHLHPPQARSAGTEGTELVFIFLGQPFPSNAGHKLSLPRRTQLE
jgi:hypothetical protein